MLSFKNAANNEDSKSKHKADKSNKRNNKKL